MEAMPTTAQADSTIASTGRKPYRSPVIRLRGTLSGLTQAVGSRNGDGGQNMML